MTISKSCFRQNTRLTKLLISCSLTLWIQGLSRTRGIKFKDFQRCVRTLWETEREKTDAGNVCSYRETYTEDVGENIKLLNSIEPCWLSDGSCVWVCEVNDTETYITQCDWYLCQLGQTERHRTTRCTRNSKYNISNCNDGGAHYSVILGHKTYWDELRKNLW